MKHSYGNTENTSAEGSKAESLCQHAEWVTWHAILIYINERCSWKDTLQHTWEQSGASKPSVLAKASC